MLEKKAQGLKNKMTIKYQFTTFRVEPSAVVLTLQFVRLTKVIMALKLTFPFYARRKPVHMSEWNLCEAESLDFSMGVFTHLFSHRRQEWWFGF
jgi:hypothetical protein